MMKKTYPSEQLNRIKKLIGDKLDTIYKFIKHEIYEHREEYVFVALENLALVDNELEEIINICAHTKSKSNPLLKKKKYNSKNYYKSKIEHIKNVLEDIDNVSNELMNTATQELSIMMKQAMETINED